MTIGEYKKQLAKKLTGIYENEEAKTIAGLLIEKLTGSPNHKQFLLEKQILTSHECETLFAFEPDLLKARPIQYILGEAWFLNKPFKVNEAVLIPRPETEELVLWVKDYAAMHNIKAPKILDVGTGSGCIPVSLYHLLPHSAITALEVSTAAISIAQANATVHQAKIDFVPFDFLNKENWPDLGSFDIIISNPPYIPNKESQLMDKNVVDWEPHIALFTPDQNPLIFYIVLEAFCKNNLHPGGAIFLECHQQYVNEVAALFSPEHYKVQTRKDIHNNERMILAEKTESE